MDWNIFFESPGYALVTNQILGLLDYKSIMVCREVSSIWKKYIDEQRIGRVSHLLSLMEKYAKNNGLLFYNLRHLSSFGEKFPEWNKIIPYIKTEMSVSDIDKLIAAKLFFTTDDVYRFMDCDERYYIWDCEVEYNQVRYWCPLHWAIHFGNLEFVEVMIRTPFDFNTLKFILKDNTELAKALANCAKCERKDEIMDHWDLSDDHDDDQCADDNNVLHKAARVGNIEIIKLILKYAEEKKIDINAKNSFNQSALVTAKDDPEVVKLLMKHCKYNDSDIGLLGLNTLATMAKSYVEKDEPPKKKKAKK